LFVLSCSAKPPYVHLIIPRKGRFDKIPGAGYNNENWAKVVQFAWLDAK
jgi:hypothetical protein